MPRCFPWSLAALCLLLASQVVALLVNPTPAGAFDIDDLTQGRLLELSFDRATTDETVELLVYVPPGYFLESSGGRRYPVLYWLHSSIGDQTEVLQALQALPAPAGNATSGPVERLDALIEDGLLEPLILVSIGSPAGVWTEAETALVTREVPAFVDRHLRTVAHRGGRGLEGFSLGAQGVSLYATERPDVFATASLLGGAFRPERWPAAADAILREDLEVELGVGADDQFLDGVLDLDLVLTDLGIPHQLHVVPEVGHSVSGLYGAIGVELLQFHSDRFARERLLDAGDAQTVDRPLPVELALAPVLDDPTGVLDGASFSWQQVDGSADLGISDPQELETTVTLTLPGVYHLRLEATTTENDLFDDVVRLSAVDTAAGLTLHLTFDSGDATDASGNGRDGALLGVPLPVDGRLGGALAFDGTDDAVAVLDFAYGPAFTVALWLHAENLDGDGYQYLASHGGFDVQPSMNLYLPENDATLADDAARLRSVLRDADDGGGEIITVADAIEPGRWHHIAVVVPSDGGHRLVVDGVERATGGHGGDAFDPSGDLFFATRAVAPDGRYFHGLLDDVRLYERALANEELLWLASAPDAFDHPPSVDAGDDRTVYRDGGAVLTGTATDADADPLTVVWSTVAGPSSAVFANPSAPITAANFDRPGVYTLRLEASDGTETAADDVTIEVVAEIEPGLVGHWPVLGAVPSDSLLDVGGLGHDAQLLGAPAPARVCSPTGRALSFDASAETVAFVDASPLLALDPAASFTVAAWLRAAPGAEGTLIARAAGTPSERQLQLFLLDDDGDGSSDLVAIVGGAINEEARRVGVRVEDGAWHHLALVHDVLFGRQQLWVDGVAIGEALPSGMAVQDVPLLLGARSLVAGGVFGEDDATTFHLDGELDDVRIYSRALDVAEIAGTIADAGVVPGLCTPLFADGFESGSLDAWF
ncbi:MAG: LamG-like jellyroll fold domain-containing protein [Acidobacteriota bacterium]